MKKKRIFTLKTYLGELYQWSPNESNVRTTKKTAKNYFCSATTGSQGQDWTTSYVYNLVTTDVEQKRLAYVECGYVE